MNIETNRKHTAEELVQEVIHKIPYGGTVSVKAVIAAVRQDGPHLECTDEALIALIVELAPAFGRAVAFDIHDE
ncbi:hypothetical protein [Mesorhizobium sp.]|uniref:hypothetical protein n=1 Tax=Mesorhizobium sp. TaxID=1871066 RepID=UPI000FE33FCF|nr:hypothetical protein [Mesorhizobium sp.]RWP62313.1 MAG: hypothetical protein EOR07_21040 [Mesorhizobium sp.]RWQ12859.1 MAG: hypothetical protein EOR92_32335 [Mesorhizobium sp.]